MITIRIHILVIVTVHLAGQRLTYRIALLWDVDALFMPKTMGVHHFMPETMVVHNFMPEMMVAHNFMLKTMVVHNLLLGM